jgi:hypothetical protein
VLPSSHRRSAQISSQLRLFHFATTLLPTHWINWRFHLNFLLWPGMMRTHQLNLVDYFTIGCTSMINWNWHHNISFGANWSKEFLNWLISAALFSVKAWLRSS